MKKKAPKKNKKAQLEISFNWIFVLIAGGAILFFFIKVINTEVDATERTTHTRAVTRMQTVFTALQQNPDSVSIQDRINYEIQFYCNEEGHSYGLKNTNARETLPHQAIYAPELIGDSRLITWVQTYKAPMPITSILYVSDEQTKYVFIKGETDKLTPIMQRFYNRIPGNFTKEITDLNTFKTRDYDGYRRYIVIIPESVTFSNVGFTYAQVRNRINYFIEITNSDVNYYYFNPAADSATDLIYTIPYATDEEALGAIITGNPYLYNCTTNKILEQTRIITDINTERIKLIHDDYNPTHTCASFYSTISQNYFTNLSKAARDKNTDALKGNITIIKNLNDRIIRSGCIAIY